MNTNDTNKNNKLIYPELSYIITGVCFDVHNQLSRFRKEKLYCDLLEAKFKEKGLNYLREHRVQETEDRVDFLIENKIILELKTKPFILKADYYQIQRYLQILDMKLGLLVNFRARYLKPLRILKVTKLVPQKFAEH